MGIICAPAYANVPCQSLSKNRFILWLSDNQFFSYAILITPVWYGSNLKDSMNELNQKHPSITFDYKFECK